MRDFQNNEIIKFIVKNDGCGHFQEAEIHEGANGDIDLVLINYYGGIDKKDEITETTIVMPYSQWKKAFASITAFAEFHDYIKER